MAPVRLVSDRQLEIIVEFAERHRDISLNINNVNGPLGQRMVKKAWDELAKKLNSVEDGIQKTPYQWKRYWHVLKCRTKAKAADIRRSQATAEAGPNKMHKLTDLEERIVRLVKKVMVEGDPERVVSERQLAIILEFAEQNQDISLNSDSSCSLSQQEAEKAWDELANKLNSISEGAQKTPYKWKRYWHMLKCRTKAKAVHIQTNQATTESGSIKMYKLTDFEERIMRLLKNVKVERDPEIKIPVNHSNAASRFVPVEVSQEADPLASCKLEVEERDDEYECEENFIGTCDASKVEIEVRGEEYEPERNFIKTCDANTNRDETRNEPHVLLQNNVPLQVASETRGIRVRPVASVQRPSNTSIPTETRGIRVRPVASVRRPSNTSNNDDDLPRWAFEFEERRVAAEERMANAVSVLSSTSAGILQCLQQMATSQAQLVELLRVHLNRSS